VRNSILILSIPGDQHATAVQLALAQKGYSSEIWYTSDFPSQAKESVFFDQAKIDLAACVIGGETLKMDAHTIWNRRARYNSSHGSLHPSDRPFAEVECYRFRNAFLDILSQRSFWVNSWQSMLRAENKLWQHYQAWRVGFDTPLSIYTNDPVEIRKFVRLCGGRIIYKPFIGTQWATDQTSWGCYTVALTVEDLVSDDLLQATPGIYQELVEKDYELRVTIMGRRIFAAKILSQQTENGKVDWRRSYEELRVEPVELPERVAALCYSLMQELNIVFGCFDLIKTPNGRYVFLEVNQQGQFLFVEQYTGLPLLDAFCEFLAQGRPDYRWNEANVDIRYGEIMEEAEKIARGSVSIHALVEPPIVKERKVDSRRELREGAA
jgi:glutathione synthase/RimK-type ligase-like ATP-grasp enzyme